MSTCLPVYYNNMVVNNKCEIQKPYFNTPLPVASLLKYIIKIVSIKNPLLVIFVPEIIFMFKEQGILYGWFQNLK
ncbi:hypothetical protein XELAEV_18000517mg [Xenopus laevis]|uniref:Uncharacterized protein n=1 Tax=Xenopus laevis TaxID=8355 RepID=A0A974BPE9_XENLA|nr:hypothetical protein XELAEV_18000517mg [Xenopus laevis]